MRKNKILALMISMGMVFAGVYPSVTPYAEEAAPVEAVTEVPAPPAETQDPAQPAPEQGQAEQAPAEQVPEQGQEQTQETEGEGQQEESGDSSAESESEAPAVMPSFENTIYRVETGYEFEDGSFDPWEYWNAVYIGNDFYAMQKTTDLLSDAYITEMVQSRWEMYSTVGVSLNNIAMTKQHTKLVLVDMNGHRHPLKVLDYAGPLTFMESTEWANDALPIGFDPEVQVDFQQSVTVQKRSLDEESGNYPVSTVAAKVTSVNAAEDTFTIQMDTDANVRGGIVTDNEGRMLGAISYQVGKDCSVVRSSHISIADTLEALQTVEEPEELDSTSLERKIIEAQNTDLSGYTEESVQALHEAVTHAKEVARDAETQSEINAAEEDIQAKIDALEKDPGMIGFIMDNLTIILIGLAGALILASVLMKKKRESVYIPGEEPEQYDDDSEELAKKKPEKKKKEKPERKARAEKKTPDVKKLARSAKKKTEWDEGDELADMRKKYQSYEDDDEPERRRSRNTDEKVRGRAVYDDDDDDGSEETTYLKKKTGYLVRIDTDERISLTKPKFIIGKERKKVDYCIVGDRNVSRKHCSIEQENGEFYVKDLQSLNFTYINGEMIEPLEKEMLHDGDVIRLADVDFEFRLNKGK